PPTGGVQALLLAPTGHGDRTAPHHLRSTLAPPNRAPARARGVATSQDGSLLMRDSTMARASPGGNSTMDAALRGPGGSPRKPGRRDEPEARSCAKSRSVLSVPQA